MIDVPSATNICIEYEHLAYKNAHFPLKKKAAEKTRSFVRFVLFSIRQNNAQQLHVSTALTSHLITFSVFMLFLLEQTRAEFFLPLRLPRI